ncbi:3239_t:CDS:2, partial [Funneliformis geosporum]
GQTLEILEKAWVQTLETLEKACKVGLLKPWKRLGSDSRNLKKALEIEFILNIK